MKSVGIDIGGTQLRVGIFDEDHNELEVFKTNNDPELTCEQNMDKLIAFINEQQDKYVDPFSGIGIGCPGPLNIPAGKVLCPPNLPAWHNFDIVEYVEARTNLRTLLNNEPTSPALLRRLSALVRAMSRSLLLACPPVSAAPTYTAASL